MAGHDQCLACCARVGIEPKLDPSSRAFKFGSAKRPSLGKTIIRFPIDENAFFERESDAADVDLPVIFGLDSMKKCGWEVGEVRNALERAESKRKIQLIHKGPNSEMLFATSDLMKLHRRFGHPS